jgi:hypothetical protein
MRAWRTHTVEEEDEQKRGCEGADSRAHDRERSGGNKLLAIFLLCHNVV